MIEIVKKVIKKISADTEYKYEIPELPDKLKKVTTKREAEYLKIINKLYDALGKDPMTGMHTKPHFDKMDKEEGYYISIDGDGLKKLNDTYGHAAGSATIKAIGKAIKMSLRSKDETATRSGGDEFVVHIKAVSMVTAITIANRILENIRKQKITDNLEGNVDIDTKNKLENMEKEKISKSPKEPIITASIGVGKTENEADKALYIAKNKGRNRIDFYKK